MSLTLTQDARALPEAAGQIPAGGLLSLPGLVLVGMALSVLLTFGTISQFMTTGFYLDPDDAMRMSQLRDYLGGQGWFDMTATRLDPPHGVFMHWTRLMDVPMAVLIRLFELVADPETAERWMRLVFPMSLLAALFASTARTARLLVGSAGPVAAMLLTVMGCSMFSYFAPGRLDHDHFAILALVVMTGVLMRALEPGNKGAAALTGIIIAFNLAISLETLPFIVMGVAAVPMAWIFWGPVMRPNLQAFALGLGGGLMLAFAITVAPSRYLDGACDTLSAAHMVAGLAGAGLCGGLAALAQRLPALPQRLIAAMVAGVATIACVALAYPACLGDPYAHIDPVLRELWLDGVSEARPLAKALSLRPGLALILVVPILIGLLGSVFAAVSERGVMRARWIALAALVLAGCAASVWQVRATGVVLPMSVFGSLYLVHRATRDSFAGQSILAVPVMAIACLLISPMFFGMLVPDTSTPEEAAASAMETSCRVQSAFAAIASLPKGIILAPIDTGGHLLARTPHGVVAAPFHRNEHGNRLALDAFRAAPEAAQAIVKSAGARYVAFCPGINDLEMYHAIAPDGLGASLDDGKVPAWLEPLALNSPYRVFAVR